MKITSGRRNGRSWIGPPFTNTPKRTLEESRRTASSIDQPPRHRGGYGSRSPSFPNQIELFQHLREHCVELAGLLQHEPMADALNSAVVGFRRKSADIIFVFVGPHR